MFGGWGCMADAMGIAPPGCWPAIMGFIMPIIMFGTCIAAEGS